MIANDELAEHRGLLQAAGPVLHQRWGVWALALLAWLLLPDMGTAAERVLQDIDIASQSGDRLEVRLEMNDAPPEPLSFSVDNPARLTFDFPDTRNQLRERRSEVNTGQLMSVSSVEAQGRTRVVLNLVDLVAYNAYRDGNAWVIELQPDGDSAPTPDQPFQHAAAEDADSASGEPEGRAQDETSEPVVAAVEDVDFRRGEQGEGRIEVDLADPNVPVAVDRESDRILVRFQGADLPDRLVRRLDVTDFATPVSFIDLDAEDGDAVMEIETSDTFEHSAFQSEEQFVLEVQPVTEAELEQRRREEGNYTGERLSLNFQDIEVRRVLQLIADFTDLNLVAAESVTGTITLRLENVPWDQALDIILSSRGLDMRKEGNVMMVAPREELAERERAELESRQALQELAPLRSEFIQANYAKAADLAQLLGQEGNRLLSSRGNVTVDERTNTLLIQDTESNLEDIRQLISRLDVPVRQVLIESRIVIADSDFSRDLGVRFGYSWNERRGDTQVGGGGALDPDLDYNQEFNDPADGGPAADGLQVSLPATGGAGQFGLAIGRVSSDLLQLELSALQQEGEGEIISNPRVITADQREAVIEQGVEIPYQEASASGASTISFKEAVLSLQATPQITPDDRVIMDLAVSQDSIGELVPVPEGGEIPSVNTQTVESQVLVDNGETVVLGGIFERERRNTTQRIPFLGSLPGIGALFRQTSRVDERGELLIFVTPRILDEGMALQSVERQ